MKNPAAVFDYAIWILQALATIVLSIYLLRKTMILKVNQGLIKVLLLMMVAESVCTLVFEFIFAFSSESTTF